jgi:hypothetical protein
MVFNDPRPTLDVTCVNHRTSYNMHVIYNVNTQSFPAHYLV